MRLTLENNNALSSTGPWTALHGWPMGLQSCSQFLSSLSAIIIWYCFQIFLMQEIFIIWNLYPMINGRINTCHEDKKGSIYIYLLYNILKFSIIHLSCKNTNKAQYLSSDYTNWGVNFHEVNKTRILNIKRPQKTDTLPLRFSLSNCLQITKIILKLRIQVGNGKANKVKVNN